MGHHAELRVDAAVDGVTRRAALAALEEARRAEQRLPARLAMCLWPRRLDRRGRGEHAAQVLGGDAAAVRVGEPLPGRGVATHRDAGADRGGRRDGGERDAPPSRHARLLSSPRANLSSCARLSVFIVMWSIRLRLLMRTRTSA